MRNVAFFGGVSPQSEWPLLGHVAGDYGTCSPKPVLFPTSGIFNQPPIYVLIKACAMLLKG